MRHLKTAVSALTIGVLLVMSIDHLAFAATGKSMVLGKSNRANKVTKLTRTTSGPAMERRVKNGAGAPIKVNSTGRIGKLDADMVDGQHAAALGVRSTLYSYDVNLTNTAVMAFTLPAVPAGSYLATVDGWIYGPTGASVVCYLSTGGLDAQLQQSFPATPGNSSFPVSTSGVVTVPSTRDLTVSCSTLGTVGDWSDWNDVEVSLTPINTLTIGTTGVAPRPRLSPSVR
jgi:hypothetical protein